MIETIVFRTISGRLSPWESLLPPELLRVPEELGRADALLDDPAFFGPFAPYFHPVPVRPAAPVECYLRLMFLIARVTGELADLAETAAAGAAAVLRNGRRASLCWGPPLAPGWPRCGPQPASDRG